MTNNIDGRTTGGIPLTGDEVIAFSQSNRGITLRQLKAYILKKDVPPAPFDTFKNALYTDGKLSYTEGELFQGANGYSATRRNVPLTTFKIKVPLEKDFFSGIIIFCLGRAETIEDYFLLSEEFKLQSLVYMTANLGTLAIQLYNQVDIVPAILGVAFGDEFDLVVLKDELRVLFKGTTYTVGPTPTILPNDPLNLLVIAGPNQDGTVPSLSIGQAT